jgi:hypothetical protein
MSASMEAGLVSNAGASLRASSIDEDDLVEELARQGEALDKAYARLELELDAASAVAEDAAESHSPAVRLLRDDILQRVVGDVPFSQRYSASMSPGGRRPGGHGDRSAGIRRPAGSSPGGSPSSSRLTTRASAPSAQHASHDGASPRRSRVADADAASMSERAPARRPDTWACVAVSSNAIAFSLHFSLHVVDRFIKSVPSDAAMLVAVTERNVNESFIEQHRVTHGEGYVRRWISIPRPLGCPLAVYWLHADPPLTQRPTDRASPPQAAFFAVRIAVFVAVLLTLGLVFLGKHG